MSRLLFRVIVLTFIGVISGCGDSKKADVGSNPKDPLEDLGQMLKSMADERRQPPAKLADLESVEPMIPLAGPLIRSGELIYLWGAGYSPDSKKVVAYERKATTEGGWVLLQDGTVQEMSASELASATKAK